MTERIYDEKEIIELIKNTYIEGVMDGIRIQREYTESLLKAGTPITINGFNGSELLKSPKKWGEYSINTCVPFADTQTKGGEEC